MQKRTKIGEDSLVYFTLEGDSTRYCCTKDEWKLYEIKYDLATKFKVSVENIELLCDLVRKITMDDYYESQSE